MNVLNGEGLKRSQVGRENAWNNQILKKERGNGCVILRIRGMGLRAGQRSGGREEREMEG